jgi:hypothetical protein
VIDDEGVDLDEIRTVMSEYEDEMSNSYEFL